LEVACGRFYRDNHTLQQNVSAQNIARLENGGRPHCAVADAWSGEAGAANLFFNLRKGCSRQYQLNREKGIVAEVATQ
jgi:hypothetical protein